MKEDAGKMGIGQGFRYWEIAVILLASSLISKPLGHLIGHLLPLFPGKWDLANFLCAVYTPFLAAWVLMFTKTGSRGIEVLYFLGPVLFYAIQFISGKSITPLSIKLVETLSRSHGGEDFTWIYTFTNPLDKFVIPWCATLCVGVLYRKILPIPGRTALLALLAFVLGMCLYHIFPGAVRVGFRMLLPYTICLAYACVMSIVRFPGGPPAGKARR